MKKYMVFAFTDTQEYDKTNELSKEERHADFQKWLEWKEDLGDLLVSLGSPLLDGKRINSSGILPDKASDIAGYMIIRAEDMTHALELLDKSPLFENKGDQKYEIFESMM